MILILVSLVEILLLGSSLQIGVTPIEISDTPKYSSLRTSSPEARIFRVRE